MTKAKTQAVPKPAAKRKREKTPAKTRGKSTAPASKPSAAAPAAQVEVPATPPDDSKVPRIEGCKVSDGWKVVNSKSKRPGDVDIFRSPDGVDYRLAQPWEEAHLITKTNTRLCRIADAGRYPHVVGGKGKGGKKKGNGPALTSAGRARLSDEAMLDEIAKLLKQKGKDLKPGAALKLLQENGIGSNPKRFARLFSQAVRSAA